MSSNPGTPADRDWDRLHEQLGSPDDPHAQERFQELAADGWDLLHVDFGSGTWFFRRPKNGN